MIIPFLGYLLLGGLAVNGIVECLHHARIFARFRAWAEAYENGFSDLVACPYCLSHHVGYLVTLALLIFHAMTFGFTWALMAIGPVVWYATVRLSNLINDVLHKWIRTPKEADLGKIEFSAGDIIGDTAVSTPAAGVGSVESDCHPGTDIPRWPASDDDSDDLYNNSF